MAAQTDFPCSSPNMEGERHRVAIVTGAASGIGEETSYAFAKRGISVVLVDMNADGLVKVAERMKTIGVSPEKVMTITEDLSEESSHDSIINQAIAKFGQIDILVNNAGYCKITPFEDLAVEQVDREYKVMFRAPLFLSQKAFPHLKNTKGCIVNISSAGSRMMSPTSITYCSIKAGLEHLTRGLALEGSRKGIRVNSIHPGLIKTPIFSRTPHEKEILDMGEKMTPLGRVGTVADIASAIMYLTSDDASYVTGHGLFVDGGMVLATPGNNFTIGSTSK